jgi:capsular exopolysaccharide synthesis family protein
VVRRRKWWVIQAVVIVPIIAFALTTQQTKEYSATASLLFRSPPSVSTATTYTDPTRQAATNSALVVLPTIAAQAAKDAHVPDGSVSVSPATDSDVVEISGTAPDPQQAARLANAYGKAYITFRAGIDRRQLDQAISTVQDNLNALSPSARAGADGTTLTQQLDQLQLQRSMANGGAEVVQQAVAPSSPSSPKMKRNIALGLLMGLILGIGLAFLRDRLDQSLRTSEELEELYDVPLLARVPRSHGLAHLQDSTADGDGAPFSTEAFRTLRANLRYFSVTRDISSILVSSPMSGDGKSTVALHLAMTMAMMGDSVVLVEADLHKPSSVILPDRRLRGGLSSVLAGAPLKSALVTVPIESHNGTDRSAGRHLTVLPAGPMPPNPSELLESDRMASLLAELESQFERVIVDSPALTQISDARALVARVSGVLVVTAVNHTRRADAEEFRKEIDLLGGNLLGVVANLVPASKRGAYGYYGGT